MSGQSDIIKLLQAQPWRVMNHSFLVEKLVSDVNS